MIQMKDENIGRFPVRLSIANFVDVVRAQAGDVPREQVRSIDLPGVVDSGAAQLVLPVGIGWRLGVRHADGPGVQSASQDHRFHAFSKQPPGFPLARK